MDELIAEHIRALDDHLRKNPTADIAIMTPGIAALGQEAVNQLVKTITGFAEVCDAHEPDEDQHIGSLAFEGRLISFKIDHYERPSNFPSPEPIGRTDRVRVIAVRLAEEN